ncbi:hypothetical protein P691DRAFT_810247 [Macrolepiota fuliginosa MF-IS2]|uniref:F-box domain-containing protein n=1 Tax=Macrolepiota fuliginosa MF-IS2 TaxID=1400762 RepID=A0A9P6BYN1_9AGAR|nr:hypothetical protein P691DRAFT_810247 [Macrolepiota fuliginosa MF-IS2]
MGSIAVIGMMCLPQELMEEILMLCDPVDVARVAMCCRRMYGIVYGDILQVDTSAAGERGRRERRAFWKALYLAQPLDDPRVCVNWLGDSRVSGASTVEGEDDDGDSVDWQNEVKRIVRARSIVSDVCLCRDEKELREVLETFLGLVEWVPPLRGRDGPGSDLARNLVWVPVVLKEFLDDIVGGVPESSVESEGTSVGETQLWRVPPRVKWSSKTKQLHAHLHTLYGLTRSDLGRRTRVDSRAFVYDMRKYTAENEYGPFKAGGKLVDWVHVQQIHHAVSMHIVWDSVQRLFAGDEEREFQYMIYPMSMPLTQTLIPRGGGEGEEEDVGRIPPVDVSSENNEESLPEGADWAAVGGIWNVCFCFCDHRELIAYNEPVDGTGELDTSLFEEEDFTEIFRQLVVDIHVTRVAEDPEHPGRPIIGFVGEMRPPSTSTMYGIVQLTSDNHLKWQFVSWIFYMNCPCLTIFIVLW